MTIKRAPQPRRWRQLTALAVGAAVLWLVGATAASTSARSAWEALGRQKELAFTILRGQLLDSREDAAIPAALDLAIGQSPVLLAGRRAVLELRRTEEGDDTPPSQAPAGQSPQDGSQPIGEEAAEPGAPLVLADNGVPAKTLIPTSPEGYVVAGDVYINNRSDNTFDEALFDGSFAAALTQKEGPQILIVHTHGSEAYTMPAGQGYEACGECRTTDQACNVVRVGEELKGVLEEAGLTVLHDTTLHDYPEYSGAYGRSLKTVEDYLEQYPSLVYVLDLHRDAIYDGDGNPYKVVSGVNGMNAAQMSFVIGTDGGGLEHPGWRENLKLAAAVQQALTEDFPTLMRPITVRNSRYNQHVTPGALLVEVGAAGNSLDEALLSARLLGSTLAEVILSTGPGL